MCKSNNPMHTMKGIQSKFKLKDDKMEKPDVYLGADISTIDNDQGGEYWAMLINTVQLWLLMLKIQL